MLDPQPHPPRSPVTRPLARAGRRLALAGGLAAALAAPAAAQEEPPEPVRLRYQWPKNLDWQRDCTVTRRARAIGDGNPADDVSTVRFWTADRVFGQGPGGRGRIARKVLRVRVEVEGAAGGRGVYDSHAPPAEGSGDSFALSAHRQYGGAIDKPATLVIDARGDVVSFDARQLGEHRSLCERGDRTLPERPVRPGDSWTTSETQSSPGLGELTTILVYELAGIEERPEGRVAVISILGAVEQEGDDVDSELQESEIEGTWELDVDRGRDLTLRMSVRMTVSRDHGSLRHQYETAIDYAFLYEE